MLITFRKISLTLLAVSALLSVNALAADIPLRGPIPFEAFDKDGNKMISPQEFVEVHNQRKKMRTDARMSSGRMQRGFTDLDTNGDNQISADELNSARGGMRARRTDMPPPGPYGKRPQSMGKGGMQKGRKMPKFSDFDLNGDGVLMREEFQNAREQRMRKRAEQGYAMRNAANAPPFGAIDTDRDGKVTEAEFAAHQAMRNQGMRPQGMGRGMNKGRNMPSFADFDLNGDGVLMREEFQNARAERMRKRAEQGYAMRNAANAPPFGAIDTDRDGKVTEAEFAAHQETHQQMRRGQ